MENVSIWSPLITTAWIAIVASFAPLLYFKFRGLSGDYEARNPEMSSLVVTWASRVCSGAALIVALNVVHKTITERAVGYLLVITFIYNLAVDAYEVINRAYQGDEPTQESDVEQKQSQ